MLVYSSQNPRPLKYNGQQPHLLTYLTFLLREQMKLPWNEGTEWKGLQTAGLREAGLKLELTLRETRPNFAPSLALIGLVPSRAAFFKCSSLYSILILWSLFLSYNFSSIPISLSHSCFLIASSLFYCSWSALAIRLFVALNCVSPSLPCHIYQCFRYLSILKRLSRFISLSTNPIVQ